MTDGIREPIKAYEYMNRFYVEEGNKRVSVLKFFGAVSIPGQVIRVLPERSDSKETEIYYEFLAFYKYSKINFLEFSKKGSYLTLQQVLGKKPEITATHGGLECGLFMAADVTPPSPAMRDTFISNSFCHFPGVSRLCQGCTILPILTAHRQNKQEL